MSIPVRPARRRWLAAMALVPAACATPPWGAASLPAPAGLGRERGPHAGERWRYALTNLYNGTPAGEVLAQATAGGPPTRVRLSRVADDTTLGDELWAGPGLLLADAGYDAPQIFERALPVHPATLATGWRDLQTTRYRIAGRDDWYWWSVTSRAVAWESVTVPAGVFTCLRVERFIRFAHPDLFRLDPSRTETLWFAPGMARFVRREWTGEYFWAGRRRAPIREDWVRWELLAHIAAPAS